jgi:hypothetical protein
MFPLDQSNPSLERMMYDTTTNNNIDRVLADGMLVGLMTSWNIVGRSIMGQA